MIAVSPGGGVLVGGFGAALLLVAEGADAGVEVGVGVEEFGGHAGGAGDGAETDLSAVFDEGSDASLGGGDGSLGAVLPCAA